MSMTLTKRPSMTGALHRSSSVSLVLPLAAPQQKSTFLCTLRRAQSSIPAIEYCVVDFNDSKSKTLGHSEKDGDQHSDIKDRYSDYDFLAKDHQSDYGSCDSSVQDLFDVYDEPQRVSKEILRSVSLSFQWLDIPMQEYELPTCREDADMSSEAISEHVQQQAQEQPVEPPSTDGRVETMGLPIGRQGSLRFAYIHECKTGNSVVSHTDLKTAMDDLGQWTMEAPRNCCLSYRHESTGEVATLPWPDLEAGGMDEIEEFVSTVNRIEKRPVFFPRYKRSAFPEDKKGSSLKEVAKALPGRPPVSPTSPKS